MNDTDIFQSPAALGQILSETVTAGFQMASEPLTGSLLRTLASSKPSGYFLELGTGTGISTAWLLDGMDDDSKLVTVENDSRVASIAQKYLGHDRRVSFHIEDASIVLRHFVEQKQKFDLIFADTWVGKYTHLQEALSLLKPDSLYIIDDMLPQANWIEGHESNVKVLIEVLESRQDLTVSQLAWASGIMIATKKNI
jgi:predicted O-methyltransferase YrrM